MASPVYGTPDSNDIGTPKYNAAGIEVWSDGKAEREEITNYDQVRDYLANGTYRRAETEKEHRHIIMRKGALEDLLSLHNTPSPGDYAMIGNAKSSYFKNLNPRNKKQFSKAVKLLR